MTFYGIYLFLHKTQYLKICTLLLVKTSTSWSNYAKDLKFTGNAKQGSRSNLEIHRASAVLSLLLYGTCIYKTEMCDGISTFQSVCNKRLTNIQYASFKTQSIIQATYGVRMGSHDRQTWGWSSASWNRSRHGAHFPNSHVFMEYLDRKEPHKPALEHAIWRHHRTTDTSLIRHWQSVLRWHKIVCPQGLSSSTTPWASCKQSSVQDSPCVEPLTPPLTMSSQHSQWYVDWQQVIFSDMFRCNLDYNDGCIRQSLEGWTLSQGASHPELYRTNV